MHRLFMIALLAVGALAACNDEPTLQTGGDQFDPATLEALTDQPLAFEAKWTVAGENETGIGVVDLVESAQVFSIEGPGLIEHRFVDGTGYLSADDGRCAPASPWVRYPATETPSVGVVGLAPGVWFDAILWNELLEFAHIETEPSDTGSFNIAIDLEMVPTSAGLATSIATLEAAIGPEITGDIEVRTDGTFSLTFDLEGSDGNSTIELAFTETSQQVPEAPPDSEICT